jgi:MFS family permease
MKSTMPAPSSPTTASAAAKRLLPWLVAVAFFMESLDTTILNTAVPAISAALGVSPLSMKAVLASYTLSLAVFIPISGWMADRFGTRRVFASAIGIFTLGSFLCGISGNIHILVACRVLQGCGGAMMVPVGRLTLVRTFAKSELIRTMSFVSIPALIAPMLGPIAGGLIVGYLHWRVIFFLNNPIGLTGLILVYLHLPDYREEHTHPLDTVGLILFGSGIGLLSYVLEIFGEHTLSSGEMTGLLVMSVTLLAGYWIHARALEFPLLQLKLFSIRTFRAAAGGGFFTRLGIGGVPFLLPLLYQLGLGFTPIWAIALQAFIYGAFTSLQYTSMNTLVYADITDPDASSASSIASTAQQMSISFGVAAAGLTTAFFIPTADSGAVPMIHGIHKALIALGCLTIASTIVFRSLKSEDGNDVSQQKSIHPGG